jgi:SAM-dependent methyltransferase
MGTATTPLEPREAMLQILGGYMISQSLYVAAKLGIADHIEDEPKSADELAASADANPDSLYRILRTLASVGIFVEHEGRRFTVTPLGALLRSGVRDSVRDWAIFRGDESAWRPWGEILHSVRTGEPAFNHVFGDGVFDHLKKNPETATVFDNAMRSISERKFRAVAKAYDFSGIETLVDVAGGNGGQLTEILRAYPKMKGVLGELPHAVESARQWFEQADLADRCECVVTDMFEKVPSGGDAYIMGHIIHDWNDELSIKILRSCQKAVKPGGRVLLVEMVVPGPNEPHFGHLVDIEMLVMTDGGRERSEAEYTALYEAAGLRLTRIVPTDSYWSVIEGYAE